MHTGWLAAEHYRLHVIEKWPNGPRKEALLSAVRSTLESLLRTAGADGSTFRCSICAAEKQRVAVLKYRHRLQSQESLGLAA